MHATTSFADTVASVVVVSVLLSGIALAEQPPRVNYMVHCMGCHLADGTGSPPDVPSLQQHLARFLLVDGGREYLIQVPGTAYSPLSNAETAEVLNWMLQTFGGDQLTDDFVAYTAEEVARHRSQALTDAHTVRDQLLAQLEQQEAADH